jgi:hypothetical protein
VLTRGKKTTVYGLSQCKGDLDSSDCKQCVANASTRIISSTHNHISGEAEGCNRTYAFIMLYGFFLPYDNHSFYGDYSETVGGYVVYSVAENSYLEFTIAIRAMLQKTLYKAANSSNLFCCKER